MVTPGNFPEGNFVGQKYSGSRDRGDTQRAPPAPPHGRALRRDEEEKPKEGKGSTEGQGGH